MRAICLGAVALLCSPTGYEGNLRAEKSTCASVPVGSRHYLRVDLTHADGELVVQTGDFCGSIRGPVGVFDLAGIRRSSMEQRGGECRAFGATWEMRLGGIALSAARRDWPGLPKTAPGTEAVFLLKDGNGCQVMLTGPLTRTKE